MERKNDVYDQYLPVKLVLVLFAIGMVCALTLGGCYVQPYGTVYTTEPAPVVTYVEPLPVYVQPACCNVFISGQWTWSHRHWHRWHRHHHHGR